MLVLFWLFLIPVTGALYLQKFWNCYLTDATSNTIINETTWFPNVSYAESMILLFLVVVWRATSGSGVYVKIKYILTLLVGLGFVFLELNLNFIIPIFDSLEFGTALFIVVVIKSFVCLWNEKGGMVWYGIPAVVLSIVTTVLLGSVQDTKVQWSGFIDFFRSSCEGNEFVIFLLSIVQQQPNVLMSTLIYIIAATGAVIMGRQTTLVPDSLTRRPKIWGVFQKIKESVFDMHKNLIHPFIAN